MLDKRTTYFIALLLATVLGACSSDSLSPGSEPALGAPSLNQTAVVGNHAELNLGPQATPHEITLAERLVASVSAGPAREALRQSLELKPGTMIVPLFASDPVMRALSDSLFQLRTERARAAIAVSTGNQRRK